MTWKTVENVREFLNRRGERRSQPHAMTERVCHWPYCKNCGLVALKNDVSRRALRAPCTFEE